MRVLVTGGAGFIGSHLVRRLQQAPANRVCVLDILHPQVHGEDARFPAFGRNVDCVKLDVRDVEGVGKLVAGFRPTHVVHLAAETGTGQSRDQPHRHCSVNVDGTAVLIEALAPLRDGLRQFILASSRAVYGEGPWRTAQGHAVVPGPRREGDLAAGRFDPLAAEHGGPVTLAEPIPADESSPASPASVYASTKLMQELLAKQSTLGERTLVLRFQNVYGAGQSLRNPYTGVLSHFCSLLLRGQTLSVYEDGRIMRDFLAVDDAVDGVLCGIAAGTAGGEVVNLGSGRPVSILSAAQELCRLFGKEPERTVSVTGQFRVGDVRHASADIAKARRVLNWAPRTSLEEGLAGLARWARENGVR